MKRIFSDTHRDHEPEWAQRRLGVPPARRARQHEQEDISAVGFAAGGRRDVWSVCSGLRPSSGAETTENYIANEVSDALERTEVAARRILRWRYNSPSF